MRKLNLILLFILLLFVIQVKDVFAETNTVDITGLAEGASAQHICVNYSVAKFDANYHWSECSLCGKKLTSNVAHNYTKSGSDSCVWNNPGQVWSCACGYSKTYKKEHILEKNSNGTVKWYHTDYHNWDYNRCSVCGTGNINYTRCVTTNGTKLGCGHTGTCKLCGTTYTGAYTEHGNNTQGYCSSWCQERYYTSSYEVTNASENRFHIKVTLTSTGNSRYTDSVFLSCQPCISDTYTYSNFSIRKIATNKYVIEQDVVCTDPTTRTNRYLRLRWQFTRDFKYNSENLDICTNVDWTAPVITGTNLQYSNYNQGYATKAKLTVTATDNLNNGYNLCYVRVLSEDKRTVITNWQAMQKLSNTSYKSEIDYTDEILTYKNVWVQVKDIQSYTKENITEKKIVVEHLDSKPPAITNSAATNQVWAKSKIVNFTSTDKGVGAVQVAWNDTTSYKTTTQSGNTYTATYNFIGDVYSSVTGTVNFKDKVNNVSTMKFKVYYLDNTAPTFTTTQTYNPDVTTINVTASDYNNKIKANGSGQTADANGNYGFYFGYSKTNNVNTATWSALTKSTLGKINISESGTYYIWVKDYVGNISSSQSIVVNVQRVITFMHNRPTNMTSDITGRLNNSTVVVKENTTENNIVTVSAAKGWEFLGWFDAPTDGNIVFDKDGKYCNSALYWSNGNWIYKKGLVVYAHWKENEYNIYYNKGLTDDINDENIADASRNTNIQSKPILNRPYTNAIYDNNVKMATLGDLKGRSYEITFNCTSPDGTVAIIENYESSLISGLSDFKINGYLNGLNWKITGYDSDLKLTSGIIYHNHKDYNGVIQNENYHALISGGCFTNPVTHIHNDNCYKIDKHTHTDACYVLNYHKHTTVDNVDDDTVITKVYKAEQSGGCFTTPVYNIHNHIGDMINGGACYNKAIYKEHNHKGSSVTGGYCYGQALYHTHTGNSTNGQGCYGTVIYKIHNHSGNSTSGGECYKTPIYKKHYHSGGAINGGGCYGTPVYHTHTGDNTKNGGCYTSPVYKKHYHNGNSTIGGDCYQTPVYKKHTHDGNSTNGGECYQTKVYKKHTHKDSCYPKHTHIAPAGGVLQTKSGSLGTATGYNKSGGCYTKFVATDTNWRSLCPNNHPWTSFDGNVWHCSEGCEWTQEPRKEEGVYVCNCGLSEARDYSTTICGKIEGQRYASEGLDYYELSCTKTEGQRYASEGIDYYDLTCTKTSGSRYASEGIDYYSLNCKYKSYTSGQQVTGNIESWKLSCGKTEGQRYSSEGLDYYALSCTKTPGQRYASEGVDHYELNCGKTETTVEGYALNCGKTPGQRYEDEGIDYYELTCSKEQGKEYEDEGLLYYGLSCGKVSILDDIETETDINIEENYDENTIITPEDKEEFEPTLEGKELICKIPEEKRTLICTKTVDYYTLNCGKTLTTEESRGVHILTPAFGEELFKPNYTIYNK